MSPTVQRPTAWTATDDRYLGQLVAFTIGDVDVNLSELRRRLSTDDLRAHVVKERIRPIDAFKRASAEIATRFTKHVDHQHALSVRQVGQDRVESHRVIVLERATFPRHRPRKVDTVTLMRVWYDRADNMISVEQQINVGLTLAPEERAWLDKMVGPDGAALRARFQAHSENLDAHGFRTVIREYLDQLDAVSLKGGLYFVPQVHVAELSSLALVVRSVGSAMQLFPLVPLPEMHTLLAQAVLSDVDDEARIYVAEIGRITASPDRRVQPATFNGYNQRVEALLRKLATYTAIVGVTLHSDELTKLRSAVDQLGRQVRGPRAMRVKDEAS